MYGHNQQAPGEALHNPINIVTAIAGLIDLTAVGIQCERPLTLARSTQDPLPARTEKFDGNVQFTVLLFDTLGRQLNGKTGQGRIPVNHRRFCAKQ